MNYLILILNTLVSISHSAPIEVKSTEVPTRLTNSNKIIKKNNLTKKSQKIAKSEFTASSNTDLRELIEIEKIEKANNQEIKKFLSKNSIAVWDFTNRFDVKTGTAVRGIILNSIVSSNLESPILVESIEDFAGIPKGSKFSCTGATKNKRVLAVCNKLISDSDEYEVDITLLNIDGTAGLLGKAYSGKEQYAVGAITAAALKSALDVSLERMNSTIGTESVSVTAKNKIKGGGIGALDEIIQMSTDEYKTQEPKISINAGKEVLVYFNRRFKI